MTAFHMTASIKSPSSGKHYPHQWTPFYQQIILELWICFLILITVKINTDHTAMYTLACLLGLTMQYSCMSYRHRMYLHIHIDSPTFKKLCHSLSWINIIRDVWFLVTCYLYLILLQDSIGIKCVWYLIWTISFMIGWKKNWKTFSA